MINLSNTELLTFSQCANQCKAECQTFLKYTALNKYLWLIYASMFLLTLFYFMNKNESALKRVAEVTKQTDTQHIQQTIEWLLFVGIGLLIAYIVIFLISNNGVITPIT